MFVAKVTKEVNKGGLFYGRENAENTQKTLYFVCELSDCVRTIFVLDSNNFVTCFKTRIN